MRRRRPGRVAAGPIWRNGRAWTREWKWQPEKGYHSDETLVALGAVGVRESRYSGLYGRYFARALLASRLGITDFVSLNRNSTQIPDGVSVERIDTGDIPDWIAWDPQENTYVLGEAKGCLTGSAQQFLGRTPSCVDAGKVQFTRVISEGFGSSTNRDSQLGCGQPVVNGRAQERTDLTIVGSAR